MSDTDIIMSKKHPDIMHESLLIKSEGCIIFYQAHVFLFLHLRYAIKVDLLWDKYFFNGIHPWHICRATEKQGVLFCNNALF